MKRILILLLLICSLVSYGQILQDPNTTPSTARTNETVSGAYTATGTDTYSVSAPGTFSFTNVPTGSFNITEKGMSITFPNPNTGSSTLAFDGLAAKNIQKWEGGSLVDVVAGDLIGTVRLRYDGTQFVMEGGTGSGGAALTEGEAINIIGDSINLGGRHYNDINIGHATEGANFKITEGDGTTTQVLEVKKDGTIVASASDGTDFSHLSISTTQILLSTGASHSGIGYSSDLSATIGANDLPQKTYVDNHIAGQDVDNNVTTPTSGEDGYVMSWDETSGSYKLVPDAGGLTEADLTDDRTITGSDDLDQTDNLNIVYANCAAPCNVTVDLLTVRSQVTVWNKGAGTVTLVAGSGVTLSSVPLETDEIAIIVYEPASTPSVRVSSGSGVTPSALTKTDDTNVTLTLGGSPSTSLLAATSLTLGWTGQLSASRGGTGLSSLGTGVATWLGTPSWTNFNSAVTGTAPFYSLATGGTRTGTNTFTGNSPNGWLHDGTWTAGTTGDFQTRWAGTFTNLGGTPNEVYAYVFRPTLVASGTSGLQYAVDISPTFSGGTTPLNHALRVQGLSIFGTANSSGYNGVIYAPTAATSGRVAMLGNFEVTTSAGPSWTGTGVQVLGSSRTIKFWGGPNSNSSDTESINLFGNTFGTNRSGVDLAVVRITQSYTTGTATASSLSMIKITDAWPTLTTPMTTAYGIDISPSGAGNATTNVAINTNANAGRVNFGSHVVFAGALMPNGSAGTSGQYLRSAGSGNVPTWSSSLVATSLETTGDFKGNFTATTSDITLDATHFTIIVDASSAARTVNLPTALSANRRIYTIKKFDNTNNVTIDANGSETIDRATTQVLSTQYSSITIQSDGTEWWILSNKN